MICSRKDPRPGRADVTLVHMAERRSGPHRLELSPAQRAVAAAADIERVRCRLRSRIVQRLGATDYLSFAQRIGSRGDSVEVIVQKPMHEVLAPYRDVRDALLVIDGIALALAAVIGTLLGRSASRPIGELVLAARAHPARALRHRRHRSRRRRIPQPRGHIQHHATEHRRARSRHHAPCLS